jgi:peptidoglycan/xylan/chitin deacetylase (PgdA/CDA1 family)
VPRILEFLRSRELPSTWFIPGHTIESFPKACDQIVAGGHEVGLHGYAHENVEQLDKDREGEILDRAYTLAETLVGAPPKGNRTPSWSFSEHTVDLLIERGLLYDSSLMATDYRPYFSRRADHVPPDGPIVWATQTRLVQLPVSWSLDDYPALEYVRTTDWVMPGLRRPDEVFANWLDDIEYMTRDFQDGVCTLTFHPQVVGRGHRMLALEAFLDRLQSNGMQFAQLATVAQAFADGREFGRYNPQRAITESP